MNKERLQPPYPPRIVEENDDFLVVDKPPFLIVHPSKPDDAGSLWDELRALLAYEIANGGQVGIINRLDRETSGLTLVAKHRAAARELGRRMMRREIGKEYLAIVTGHPQREEWEVDAPLLRKGAVAPSAVWVKQIIDPAGATALSRFRVERRFTRDGAACSIVRCFPATGRMHQLRVHLAHSGHPVVGDKLYGPGEDCYLTFIETGWTPALASRLILPRQALHSCALSFGGREWRTGLPVDLAEFCGEGGS